MRRIASLLAVLLLSGCAVNNNTNTNTNNNGRVADGASAGGSVSGGGASSSSATARTPRLLYRDTVLTFSSVEDCSDGDGIELDVPKVKANMGDSALTFLCVDNSFAGQDVNFSLSAAYGGVSKLAVANGATDAASCQKEIDVAATDTFDLRDAVPGQTALCVRDQQGDIALVKITSVGSVHDGKLTLTVTAWH